MIAAITWQPWFAVAGLLAVSLPLWMHLYQRVASKRVPVSSLRLVPVTPRIARARRRIKHWLLFLLRALGVLLLGLAFARPGLDNPGEDSKGRREAVVFVLDRSGSMAMRANGGGTAWDEAVGIVRDRLASLHPQSRARLFCFPPAETGSDWVAPAEMTKVVANLQVSAAEGQPLDALRGAAEALARFRSDMPEALEMIGDLQRVVWDEIDTLTLPEELQVRVRPVGQPEAPNRGLSLEVRGRDQLRRGAVVTRGGGGVPMVVRDRAGDDGTVSQEEHPLPDEVLELPYRAKAEGWVRREVSLAQSSDGLPADDTLFDSFYVSAEVPVYLLEPRPGAVAFQQATFFLHQALRPTTGDAAEDSRFLPQAIPVDEASAKLSDLDEPAGVVIVPAIEKWPADLPAVLGEFVRGGGGVLFFGGPEMDARAFTNAWRELLPAQPGEVSEVKRSLALPPVGEDHPLWGGFGEEARQDLRRLALRTRFALETAADAEVLARYSDEVPLVVAKTIGKGRALFINTSADRAWGDWAADDALFVPSVHMLASAAVTATPQLLRNSPGAGIVGVPFDVRVDPALAGKNVASGGQSLTVDHEGWLRGLRFDQPGIYDLKATDGAPLRPVAVNFPPAESVRDFLEPGILDRQLEARRRTAGAGGDPARIKVVAESNWWRWILTALAFLWLAEAWLAMGARRLTPTDSPA